MLKILIITFKLFSKIVCLFIFSGLFPAQHLLTFAFSQTSPLEKLGKISGLQCMSDSSSNKAKLKKSLCLRFDSIIYMSAKKYIFLCAKCAIAQNLDKIYKSLYFIFGNILFSEVPKSSE